MREKNDWLKKIMIVVLTVVLMMSAIGMNDVTAYVKHAEPVKETELPVVTEKEETVEEKKEENSLEERYKSYGFNVTVLTDSMRVTTDSNVRSGPSTEYNIIGQLEKDTIVEVVGQADTGWYLVKYGAAKAFISNSLLAEVTVEEPTVEVAVAETPAPTVEAPVVEVPVTEAPAVEIPVVEVPVTETPVAEVPAVEAPAVEVPVAEVAEVEAPVVEEPQNGPLGFPIREHKWEYSIDELTTIAVMSCVHKGMSQWEMAIAINDYLCETVTYDDSLTRHSAFDALAYGSAVCQGYANAYQRMMNAVGIPTDYVRGYGYTSNGQAGRHGWNRVLIDGNYYYVDVTWNDSTNSNKYLLISYEEMSKDHYQTELNPRREM